MKDHKRPGISRGFGAFLKLDGSRWGRDSTDPVFWTTGVLNWGCKHLALSGLYWYIHHHWIVSQLYSDYLLLIWINLDKSICIISHYIYICTTNLGHVIWVWIKIKDLDDHRFKSLFSIKPLIFFGYPILTHSKFIPSVPGFSIRAHDCVIVLFLSWFSKQLFAYHTAWETGPITCMFCVFNQFISDQFHPNLKLDYRSRWLLFIWYCKTFL